MSPFYHGFHRLSRAFHKLGIIRIKGFTLSQGHAYDAVCVTPHCMGGVWVVVVFCFESVRTFGAGSRLPPQAGKQFRIRREKFNLWRRAGGGPSLALSCVRCSLVLLEVFSNPIGWGIACTRSAPRIPPRISEEYECIWSGVGIPCVGTQGVLSGQISFFSP